MRSSKWIVCFTVAMSLMVMMAAVSFAQDSETSGSESIGFTVDNISVAWDAGIFAEVVAPTASAGFQNVYSWTGSFTVASSTSYSIVVEVTPSTGAGTNPWDNFDGSNGTVVMNVNNPVVTNATDFARAFDISVKSRKGVADLDPNNAVYTEWITAAEGAGTEMVSQEPNTLGLTDNEYSHAITLALVLVDDAAVSPAVGADPQPTAGYDASNTVDVSRRFVELPTGTFDTTVTVTITEDLTGQ